MKVASFAKLITTIILLMSFLLGSKLEAKSAVKPAAKAVENDADTIKQFENILVDAQYRISGEQPGCPYCTTDAGLPTMAPACLDTYKDFYSKPTLDLRVMLGYADNGLDVDDGPMRTAWIDRLTNNCKENEVGTCGFVRGADPKNPDRDDEEIFSKFVEGPDGKQHTVVLHIVSSSVTQDDLKNRGDLKAAQLEKTQHAEETFFGGLASADLVLYVGHARHGGGPSAEPPFRKSDGLSVDYQAKPYITHASERRMLAVLKANSQPPKLLGIFACDGGRLFSDDVTQASHHLSGVVTSIGLTSAESAYAQAFSTLDSVLALRCQTEFEGAYEKLKKFRTADRVPAMKGFFKTTGPSYTPEENPVPPKAVRAEPPRDSQIHPGSKIVTIPDDKKSKSDHSKAAK